MSGLIPKPLTARVEFIGGGLDGCQMVVTPLVSNFRRMVGGDYYLAQRGGQWLYFHERLHAEFVRAVLAGDRA